MQIPCLLLSSYHRLTAYVAKVFAIAYKLSSKVEKYILCDAINWVIINSQKSDGSFGEVGVVSDGRIMVSTEVKKYVYTYLYVYYF